MKKFLQFSFCLFLFSSTGMLAQVPNGGFENWTAGIPDNWYTNNFTGIATPITQATPAHSGSYAAKGEVVNSIAGNFPPLLSSVDSNMMGFAVTQAYADLTFYYKTSMTSTEVMSVAVIMNDAGQVTVGGGSIELGGTVGTYTLAT